MTVIVLAAETLMAAFVALAPTVAPIPPMVNAPVFDTNTPPVPPTASRLLTAVLNELPLEPMPPDPAVMTKSSPRMSVVAVPETTPPDPALFSEIVTSPPFALRLPAPLNNTPLLPPVVSMMLVAAERVIASLTVIAPLLESPIWRLPAVMRSSSASVSPRVPAASAPPRSMFVPFV